MKGNSYIWKKKDVFLLFHYLHTHTWFNQSKTKSSNLDNNWHTHAGLLTSSIFFCISFSWLSHSLLSTSNLSSSSAFSLDQSLAPGSRRQRRSMAVGCVSSRSLRCSSLTRRGVDVSPCCSRARRTASAPPLINPAPSLASNWREKDKEETEGSREWGEEGVGETLGKLVSGDKG